ncbi:MAG: hypothetical protein KBT09_00325, partial [Bacteroidales bacterium]|nr:hypothetical protein [Candidatus Sodaliphilus fimicaballi]
MLATSSMWAQQGTTHDHPIDDATVKSYVSTYLGYNANGEDFTEKWQTAPTGTTVGDLIFVEVNDYWKASNWSDRTTTVENYVKYGVKSINKVTQHTEIGSGDLYHFDATTNRFFFAIRTGSYYTGNNGYTMPFRWYNEFSAVGTGQTSADGWDNMTAAYGSLKDGDFYPVPHSCSNSLEKNHFTSLYAKTTTGETYPISAMLFVPRGANGSTNNKEQSFSGTNIPQVFFYVSSLEGTRIKNTVAGSACEYSANLKWQTSFDKAKASQAVNFTAWNNTVGGVKEESTIYRKVADGQWEVVAEGLIDTKTYIDNTLPDAGKEGYSVEYYVETKAVTYDENGNRTGNVMGTTTTNHIILHIPGSESFFELEITNDFNSKYTPSNGTIGAGYNTITNAVKPSANEFSPKLGDIKQGDKLELVRMENGKTDVAANTVKITDIATEHVYEDVARTFSVSGKYNNVTLSKQTDISIDGYTAYGIASSDLSYYSQTGTVTVKFDGTELPRKIYAKLYVSNSDATATATINGGGTGTITQSTSNRFGSLDRFTEISMTGNTLTFNTSAKRPAWTDYTTRFVILVPNNITERIDKGIETTYKYTVNGEEASIKNPTDLEPILKAAANYTETVNVAPGKVYDVKYQMVYTSADGKTVLRSNTVASKSMSTEVKAEKLYRSGTPDPENNAAQELYTCRVSFKPVMDNRVAYYNIWQNGKEKIMRVGQSGTTFTLIGKDKNGQFNQELCNISRDDDGFLNVRVDAALDKHANDYELAESLLGAYALNEQTNVNAIQEEELFFTVEVCANSKTGENTYGNIEYGTAYTGSNIELVYNSTVNVFTDNHGNFRAEIDWIKMFDEKHKILEDYDYVLRKPDYYTVYRTMVDGTGEYKYEPITARYIGHDGQDENPVTHEIEEAGFTKVDETTDGSAYKFTQELIEEIKETRVEGFKVFDFIKLPELSFTTAQNINSFFPAMYYVKAHYEKPFEAQTFIARNYIEKNSNPTTTSLPIVTEIEDLQTSQVVSVKYYNMMGIEVAQPEAGEIVVART